MRRRPLVLAAALAALAVPAPAHAAVTGKFFPGDPIDAGVTRVGDIDLARDGSGGVVYLKQEEGAEHVFVSRIVNGALQPPERLDPGIGTPAANPVIAVSDGGRIAVAWESAGAVLASVKPAGDQGWTGAQALAAAGSRPALDLSINGVGYAVFTTPGGGGGDVHAARLDRKAATFNPIDGALDVAPANAAGTGTGRPRVAVSADGTAVVVWGEAGGANARRLFEYRLSANPQALGDGADAPDIGLEDDSSFGWAVFRQGPSILARRLLGSTFDPPVDLGSAEPPTAPRIALGGRGDGYATFGGQSSAGVYGAVLKDDAFSPGQVIGGGFGVAPDPATAVSYSGDGIMLYQQGDPSGTRSIHARVYDLDPRSRLVTAPGPEAVLSRPELGLPDADRGLVAAADRTGDFVMAWLQGDPGNQQLVVSAFDRAPGSFRATSTTKFRAAAQPPLVWSAAAHEWGPITYTIVIDGKQVGQVQDVIKTTSPVALADGVHRWYVVASDRRGQATRTPTRYLRVDATPPSLKVSIRRSGGAVTVSAKAKDPGRGSGLRDVVIDFGDRTPPVVATKAVHRYRGKGSVTVRVTATDQARGKTVYERKIKKA